MSIHTNAMSAMSLKLQTLSKKNLTHYLTKLTNYRASGRFLGNKESNMNKFEISIEELQRRAANGDTLAIIALEYRAKGPAALISDLKKK